MTFDTLNRVGNGTLFLRNTTSPGQSIGGGPAGPNRTNFFLGSGVTTLADPLGPNSGQNTAIVPYLSGSLAGNSDTASADRPTTLATYDANGAFVLDYNDSTYFNVVSGATGATPLAPHVNNSITAATPRAISPIQGVTQINALVYTPSASGNGLILSGISQSGGANAALQVYSGAIVNGATINALTFRDLTLDFGGNTGYLYGGTMVFDGTSAITGSGGVSVNLSAVQMKNTSPNTFTGGFFVNTGSVSFTQDNQLGASGEGIFLNGGQLLQTTVGTASLPATRPITLSGAGGILGTTNALSNWNIASPITGIGSLTINGGQVTLSGVSNYSGDTIINTYSVLTLAGTNQGNGNTVANAYGTLQYIGPSNVATGSIVLNYGSILQPLSNSVLPNNIAVVNSSNLTGIFVGDGLSSTLSGIISGRASLDKGGAGELVLTGTNTISGNFGVHNGTLTLRGNGSLVNANQIQVGSNSVLRLDDTGGTTINHLGSNTQIQLVGELRWETANGVAATQYGEIIGSDAFFGGGTLTILPGAGGSASLTTQFGSAILYRGMNLGGNSGTFSRILISGIGAGVITGASADASATGLGTSLAFYDTTLGVRPGRPSDYTTGSLIQNAAPTSTPTTANFRVVGASATSGSTNTVNSLTLAPGSTLDASSGKLTVASQTIFTEAGAPSVISGGTLAADYFVTAGDLTINSIIADSNTFSGFGIHKRGSGTLTLSGANTVTGSVYVSEGTLRLASGVLLPPANSSLYVAGGATFDTGPVNVTAFQVVSNGNIILGQVASGFSLTASGSFFGTISGPGSLKGSGLLGGPNSYSGGTTGTGFYATNPMSFGTGPVQFSNTSTNTPVYFQQLGTATVANNFVLSGTGGITTTLMVDNRYGSSNSLFGSPFKNRIFDQDITLSGKISGGSTAANTALGLNASLNSVLHLTNTANDFRGTVNIGQGTVAITSNQVLGNPANDVTLPVFGSTLRMDAPNIVLARNVSFGPSSNIDTNGNDAVISGVVGGTTTGGNLFNKLGGGTLTLSNAGNTYTGSIAVNTGTLAVTGFLGTATSTGSVQVGSGAKVAGTGTIRGGTGSTGAIALNYGGTLSPGMDSVKSSFGTLTATSLTAQDGTLFDFDLNLSSTASDKVVLTTFFNKGVSGGIYTFNFSTTGTLDATPHTYTLATFGSTNFSATGGTGTDGGDFSYNGLPAGLVGAFTYNANSLTFTVSNGAVVPEPKTLLFLVVGMLTVGAIRAPRHRQKV